ncbi:MAG TPA: DUF2617 family protein [Phycisphaeraceae bacterium]
MTPGPKSPSVQTYRLLLYQRALHPELFRIHERRTLEQTDYEVEAWIMPGSHVLRFQLPGMCLTEAVIDQEQQMPQRGLVQAMPCLGEKELEDRIEKVRYVSSVQTELLSDNLYTATYNEMKDFAQESAAMYHEWTDAEGGQNLSVVDLQRYKKELHAQTYHLIGAAGFVLRTQSIFELT